MNKIDLIIDALENCKRLTQIDRAHLKKALAAARELKDIKPTLFYGRAVYFADPKTGEVKHD